MLQKKYSFHLFNQDSKKFFLKNGFLIIKNFFKKKDIKDAKKEILKNIKKKKKIFYYKKIKKKKKNFFIMRKLKINTDCVESKKYQIFQNNLKKLYIPKEYLIFCLN